MTEVAETNDPEPQAEYDGGALEVAQPKRQCLLCKGDDVGVLFYYKDKPNLICITCIEECDSAVIERKIMSLDLQAKDPCVVCGYDDVTVEYTSDNKHKVCLHCIEECESQMIERIIWSKE